MTAIALLSMGLLYEHGQAILDVLGLSSGHHHHHHHHCCQHAHGIMDHAFTIAGSVCIVIAHIMNIRHCHCIKHPGEGTCSH